MYRIELTLEGNDVLPASNIPSEFDCTLHRFRPRVPEVEGIQRWVRHYGKQPFDKLEIRSVECDTALPMD